MAQYQRGTDDTPGPEMGPVLLEAGEPADLKHIRVGPGAGAGQGGLPLELGGGLQILNHGGPGVGDVAGCAVEIVRTIRNFRCALAWAIVLARPGQDLIQPGRASRRRMHPTRCGSAPVAIFNQHRLARLVQQIRPPGQVFELTTPVQLHPVKSVLDDGSHIALHVLLNLLRRCVLVLTTDAIIHVPSSPEAEAVGVVGHGLQIWKRLRVDNRVAISIMERPVHPRLTRLPVVIEPAVHVPQILQARQLPIHHPHPLRHAVHH
mmetsp:Transcript_54140/g.116248  ORF Transcript_54140/g.116248 Transcript_54140/m.116248 type:complete len:263 (+) Transcript_54140:973-1761(+)